MVGMNAPAFFPRANGGRHRFTVDDVYRMVEAGVFAPDADLEVLDGEIIDMPSEGELHLTFKDEIVRILVTALGREWRVIPDGSLHLSADDAPSPDFYVIARSSPLKPVDSGAVALVVEIADTSLGYDLGRKASVYARYDLPEYWVVDVHARVTHVLTLPENGTYRDVARVAFGDTLTSGRLPQVSVRFDEVVPA
jgi:Uma2 family endonuclease